MVPHQPCIDKYGSNVCNLPRFENTTADRQRRRYKSELTQEAEQILSGITTRQDRKPNSTGGGDAQPKFSTKRNSNLPPSKRKEEREDTQRDVQTNDFTPYRQPMPRLRPNAASLSVEERAKAQMVRAGKTAYKKGFAAARAEMDAGALRGWTIDTELS